MRYKTRVKIKINNRNHCIEVQNKLFEMGYFWKDGKIIKHEHAAWLFLDPDGSLLYSENQQFESDDLEIFLNNYYEIY